MDGVLRTGALQTVHAVLQGDQLWTLTKTQKHGAPQLILAITGGMNPQFNPTVRSVELPRIRSRSGSRSAWRRTGSLARQLHHDESLSSGVPIGGQFDVTGQFPDQAYDPYNSAFTPGIITGIDGLRLAQRIPGFGHTRAIEVHLVRTATITTTSTTLPIVPFSCDQPSVTVQTDSCGTVQLCPTTYGGYDATLDCAAGQDRFMTINGRIPDLDAGGSILDSRLSRRPPSRSASPR